MAREMPILMCPEKVKAILEGRMTQFRTIIKNMPEKWHTGKCAFEKNGDGDETFIIYGKCGEKTRYAPYRVGDVLWVKELWRCTGGGSWKGVLHKSSGPETAQSFAGVNDGRAITVPEEFWPQWDRYVYQTNTSCNWQSAHSMPKWAAAHWLRVTAVKEPHQIQNISKEDCIAEGTQRYEYGTEWDKAYGGREHNIDISIGYGTQRLALSVMSSTAQSAYGCLWNRLHPKSGERFEDGPWIFPTVFERIKK